jgi:hypothetical protein
MPARRQADCDAELEEAGDDCDTKDAVGNATPEQRARYQAAQERGLLRLALPAE